MTSMSADSSNGHGVPTLGCFPPPFRIYRGRQGIEVAEERDHLPDMVVGYRLIMMPLTVPCRHAGVPHAVPDDPEQLPVRQSWRFLCKLRNIRVKTCAVVAGLAGLAVTSGTSVFEGLHPCQQVFFRCRNWVRYMRCVPRHISIQRHLRKALLPSRRTRVCVSWPETEPSDGHSEHRKHQNPSQTACEKSAHTHLPPLSCRRLCRRNLAGTREYRKLNGISAARHETSALLHRGTPHDSLIDVPGDADRQVARTLAPGVRAFIDVAGNRQRLCRALE